jgi:hypothetical protein
MPMLLHGFPSRRFVGLETAPFGLRQVPGEAVDANKRHIEQLHAHMIL